MTRCSPSRCGTHGRIALEGSGQTRVHPEHGMNTSLPAILIRAMAGFSRHCTWNGILHTGGRGYSTLRPVSAGTRLRRDNWVSVRYAEELNSGESSATLWSTRPTWDF